MWLEIQDQGFRQLVDGQEFLYGAYLVIAAGCAIAVVSAIGLIGALCETKINKFLLGFVSERWHVNTSVTIHTSPLLSYVWCVCMCV